MEKLETLRLEMEKQESLGLEPSMSYRKSIIFNVNEIIVNENIPTPIKCRDEMPRSEITTSFHQISKI